MKIASSAFHHILTAAPRLLAGLRLSGVVLVAMLVLMSPTLAKPLPEKMSAVLLLKSLELVENLDLQDPVKVLVLGNVKVANTLEALMNNSADRPLQVQVLTNQAPELVQPDVIFLSPQASLPEVMLYAEQSKVLTVTDNIDLATQGVVLTLYDNEGLPGIILNVGASRASGVQWSPQILEVADPL
ncbi:MAG: hypothetical protein AseanaTS_16440 [Candidatus Pelagadaptatus aseana]|uniref:YfiR family protein n=1 Tax=Candidatus Pelagadaptatus aseana TaxID=3120508 RepID=UPI0039B1C309